MRLATPTPLPAVKVNADRKRVLQVMTNLLSNAVRHSVPGGVVTVAVQVPNDRITVAVTNAGDAMSPDETARVFDRFYRGSTSRGSGLGLAIAKGIVTAHGGEIAASSEVGRGTTFTFTLPRHSRE